MSLKPNFQKKKENIIYTSVNFQYRRIILWHSEPTKLGSQYIPWLQVQCHKIISCPSWNSLPCLLSPSRWGLGSRYTDVRNSPSQLTQPEFFKGLSLALSCYWQPLLHWSTVSGFCIHFPSGLWVRSWNGSRRKTFHEIIWIKWRQSSFCQAISISMKRFKVDCRQ